MRPFGVESVWHDVDWAAPLWQLLSALERVSSLHPLSVIARKRLDISFLPDISRAVRMSLKAMLPGGAGEIAREQAYLEVLRAWNPAGANCRFGPHETARYWRPRQIQNLF